MAKSNQYDDAIWKDERVWQTLYQAGKIADMVVAQRCEKGEATGIGDMIFQVCAKYKEHNKRDVETTSEFQQALNRANFVLTLWEKVSVEERQRLCAGWMIPMSFQTSTELLDEWKSVCSETDHYLVMHCCANGDVVSTTEMQLTENATDPVRVLVRSGSTREETMAALLSVIQTLNLQWEYLIAMPSIAEDAAAMMMPSPSPLSSVGAEKKPRTESQKPASKLGGKSGKATAVAA